MRKLITAALIAFAVLALVPACASAGEVSGRAVSRVEASDIARQILGQVRSVELGSSTATITVEADGASRPLSVSIDDLTGSAPRSEGASSGLARLVAIPFLLGALVRLLRFLSKLGGM